VPQDIAPTTTDPTISPGVHANVGSLVDFNRQRVDVAHVPGRARAVRSVGIVGAGKMGAAIAASTAAGRLPVVITDADPNVLANLPQRLAVELGCADRRSGAARASTAGRFVRPTTDHAAIARCDLVLETVTERPEIKRQVFADLEPRLGGETILASNTSTLPITRLAAGLAVPSRFCGLHFFYPVAERPLVEIVRGPATSDETVAAAVSYVKTIGKIPLVVHDGPGFVVNRLLLPYVSEAMQLLLEGAAIEDVERAGTNFGMALGPLTLLDQIGMDTALDCGWVLSGAYPENVASSPLLMAMVKAGRLGQKSGAGFFAYEQEPGGTAARRPDPVVEAIIARWAEPPRQHTTDTITARLFLLMLLEATRILQEKKVTDPRLVDLGVIFGLGFPESRGGILSWADTLGAARVVRMLRPFGSLGPRARPTPLLVEMAEKNRRFYDTAT